MNEPSRVKTVIRIIAVAWFVTLVVELFSEAGDHIQVINHDGSEEIKRCQSKN